MWNRVQDLPGSVRAATVGIALIALALGAWMLAPGQEHRVPVAPILQSETTASDPAPEPATDTTASTVVTVTEASGEGSQSMDVSTDSSASAAINVSRSFTVSITIAEMAMHHHFSRALRGRRLPRRGIDRCMPGKSCLGSCA